MRVCVLFCAFKCVFSEKVLLDGQGIESWWGLWFSAPVQTGPGAHPLFYTMGTGSFPGVKRPGRDADHPPPSRLKIESVELHLHSPLWAFLRVAGWPLPFTFSEKRRVGFTDSQKGPWHLKRLGARGLMCLQRARREQGKIRFQP